MSRMEFKTISGVKLPVLGIGTWKMGMAGGLTDKQEIDAIKAAVDLGMTHIDTAEIYSEGHSEELVAEAIKGYDRNDLFITTKVWRTNLEYDAVIKAAKGSLERLETSYIDLLLIHWPNPEIPISETIAAMDYLVEQGLVKHIGVSNFSVEQIKEAQGNSKNAIFTDQVEYSLEDLSPEKDILSYCQQNNMFLTAYSPLGRGNLAYPGYNPLLDEIAKKYNKTVVQVALNYLISRDNVIAIPKSGNVDHIKEIVGSVGWQLSQADIEILREEFR
ncbi:MAG: hypothetical protein US86_C0012G0013 [Candidatus Daviesbacteria bacterium GW2011_GWA2_38_24]|uniref:NADP-dependent oxidoreductase domain-containing protein n=1 Tax=Candidatus Daviesbacteria bacterium GW2011_GWA2_38_24 TaxID=1618422 RepID=A0A0G0JCC5_9BACT|nr:MAG: hypothetical protein US86_C0012G0013 [Candidatus Daviesbacteria bacterium GW2011_GWA2_38_24]